jgi:hypothetical protein
MIVKLVVLSARDISFIFPSHHQQNVSLCLDSQCCGSRFYFARQRPDKHVPTATKLTAFQHQQYADLCNWILFEKPPVTQLLKNFTEFYGSRNFTTVLTTASPGPYHEPDQSSPYNPIKLCTLNYGYLSLTLSFVAWCWLQIHAERASEDTWLDVQPHPLYTEDGESFLLLASIKEGAYNHFTHIKHVTPSQQRMAVLTHGSYEVIRILSWDSTNHLVWVQGAATGPNLRLLRDVISTVQPSNIRMKRQNKII